LMDRGMIIRILLCHTCIPQDTVLPLLQTRSQPNHNIKAGVANSSDTNTTFSLDVMASCCNLQRERESEELVSNHSVFVVRFSWRKHTDIMEDSDELSWPIR
jgi:hypothetical protein